MSSLYEYFLKAEMQKEKPPMKIMAPAEQLFRFSSYDASQLYFEMLKSFIDRLNSGSGTYLISLKSMQFPSL